MQETGRPASSLKLDRFTGQAVPILKYTLPILEEMAAQVLKTGTALTAQSNGSLVSVSWSAEPFLNPFAHSRGGAYPHPPTRQVTPSNPNIVLQSSAPPQVDIVAAVRELSTQVQARAVEEGQSRWDDLLYPNYALAGTPLELMYGENVGRLQELAKKVDPKGIMKLAGGFKFD